MVWDVFDHLVLRSPGRVHLLSLSRLEPRAGAGLVKRASGPIKLAAWRLQQQSLFAQELA